MKKQIDNNSQKALDSVRKAWEQHVSSSPVLDEAWLRRAVIQSRLQNEKPLGFFDDFQVVFGVALSAALSMLLFFSSKAMYQSSYAKPSALSYLVDANDYFLFKGNLQ